MDNKQIYTPRGDPVADIVQLTDAIAALHLDLWNKNGQLVWLNAGELVPVNADILSRLIQQHILVKHLIDRGGRWSAEIGPLVPDDATLKRINFWNEPGAQSYAHTPAEWWPAGPGAAGARSLTRPHRSRGQSALTFCAISASSFACQR
jgi:hypothetical protein